MLLFKDLSNPSITDIRKLLDMKEKNVFSQCGEDGVIEFILEKLDSEQKLQKTKWCVEFGAWDGIHFSNTCNLIKNKEFNAVLIEADKLKCKKLQVNFPSEKVIKLNKFVQFEGEDILDNILSKTDIPLDFELLSIDIDGNDYHVFDSIEIYSPKIVVIEYNHTIPDELSYIQPKDNKKNIGSSRKAIYDLGISKGYFLAHCTDLNLIFIKKEYNNLFKKITLKEVHRKITPTYLFQGYDGSLVSNKEKISMHWHSNIEFEITKLSPIPRFIRYYQYNFNLFQKIYFALFLLKVDSKKLRDKIFK